MTDTLLFIDVRDVGAALLAVYVVAIFAMAGFIR